MIHLINSKKKLIETDLKGCLSIKNPLKNTIPPTVTPGYLVLRISEALGKLHGLLMMSISNI